MGAEYIDFSIDDGPLSKVREAFNSQRENDRDYNGHQDGYSGDFQTVNDVRVQDKIFDSYDEASDYIQENAVKWEYAIAVKYREFPEASTNNSVNFSQDLVSKKMLTLKQKIEKEKQASTALQEKLILDFKNRKSKMVSCGNCGSKLNKEYIHTGSVSSIRCPLCKESLLAKTSLDRLSKIKSKIKNIEDDLKQEEKKVKAKNKDLAKVKWLIGAWCAC